MGRYAESVPPESGSIPKVSGVRRQRGRVVREPTEVLDASNPPFYRWFADGVMNTCFNALIGMCVMAGAPRSR